jgi:hypothetical protein
MNSSVRALLTICHPPLAAFSVVAAVFPSSLPFSVVANSHSNIAAVFPVTSRYLPVAAVLLPLFLLRLIATPIGGRRRTAIRFAVGGEFGSVASCGRRLFDPLPTALESPLRRILINRKIYPVAVKVLSALAEG